MKIIVIGGGAAGFFAAIHHKHAFPLHSVTIIEKSEDGLEKVKISGGGRCNVTHACFDPRQLADFYPRGGKALIGPFQYFQPRDTMNWFQTRGVPLKIESDNRVFPVSNSSDSIVEVLTNEAATLGITIWNKTSVSRIQRNSDGTFHLDWETGSTQCNAIILCTGSSRKGYELAKSLGHQLVPPVPSLFTLKISDASLTELAGISVATATATTVGSQTWKQTGPLLITHWGFSGPAIIRLSAWAARDFAEKSFQLPVTINWLSIKEDAITSLLEFNRTSCKKWVGRHSISSDLPIRLWEYLVKKSIGKIDTPWNELGNKAINLLKQVIINDRYITSGKGIFKEEFVTCGGIPLKEVQFKTMESRLCPGLYFAGEILDIDGITGGFNFQNAWTTGVIAGENSGHRRV